LDLNNWYQSTFLGQRREDLFSLFAEIFLGKKKRATHFRFRYKVLRAEFGKINCVFEFLSEKYPISKNKVMSILNSTIFQGFYRKSRDFLP
jgi:hypothetical protein